MANPREGTLSTWLTAEQAAEYLGVSVKHVRRHAAALGAVKLGTGKNAPLRFKASIIDSRIVATYQLDPKEELSSPASRRPPKMSPPHDKKMSPPRDKNQPRDKSHAKEDRDVG